MSYREVIYKLNQFDPFAEILIARMADLGFDSFQEEPPFIKAYISHEEYSSDLLEELNDLKEQIQLVSDQDLEKINWNEEWEKNFPPLSIDTFCHIRAPFHPTLKGFEYELIIEPKMSFGTGHHATTQNMIRLMKNCKWPMNSVLDVGSGTGILAILAAKLGAETVFATDIEEWAFENMQENFERNSTAKNSALLGSLPLNQLNGKKFDLILANINKNVLLDQIQLYKNHLKSNGLLLLSGFYNVDEQEVSAECNRCSMLKLEAVEKDNWMAIAYQLTIER